MNKLWAKSLFLATTAFMALGSGAASLEQQDRFAAKAQDLWIDGYYQITTGEEAERQKKFLDAIKSYSQALEKFRAVSREYPDWHPEIISFRIRFCESRIRSLKKALEKNKESLSETELQALGKILEADTSSMNETINQLRQAVRTHETALINKDREISALRQKLEQASGALEKIAAMEAEGKRLADTNGSLARDLELRGKELAETGQKLAAKEGEMKELQDRLAQLEQQLKDQLGQADRKFTTAQGQANAAILALQQEKQALAEAKAKLEQDAQVRQQERDGLVKEIDSLKQLLAAQRGQAEGSAKIAADKVTELEKKVANLESQMAARQQEAEATAKALAEAKTELATKTARLAEVENSLAGLRETGSAQQKALAEKLDSLGKELEAKRQEAQALGQEKKDLLEKVAAHTATIAKLEQEGTAKQGEAGQRLADLQKQLAETQNQLKSRSDALTDLSNAKAALENRMADLRNDFDKMKQAYEGLQATSSTKAQGLADSIAGLKNDIAQRDQALARSETDKANLTKRLQESQAALDASRKQAETAAQEALKQATEIKSKLADTEKDLRSNVESVKALTAAKEALELDLNRTRNDLAAAAAFEKKFQEGQEQLKSQVLKIKELEQNGVALSGQLDEARRQLADSQAALATLGKESQRQAQALQDGAAKLAQLEEVRKRLAEQAEAKEKALAEQIAAKDKTLAGLQAEGGDLKAKLAEKGTLVQQLEANLAAQVKKLGEQDALLKKMSAQNYEALEKQLLEKGEEVLKLEAEGKRLQQELTAKAELENRFRQAEQERIAREKKKAEEERAKAQKEQDRKTRVFQNLTDASLAEKNSDYETAIEKLMKALEDDPENAKATERLGLILAARKQDSKAEVWLSRSFKQNPTNRAILMPLALVQLRLTKTREAVATTAMAAALEPDNAEFQKFFGLACNELGGLDLAETSLKETLRLNPKDMEAAYNLAQILVYKASESPRQDYGTEAKKWYDEAVRLGMAKDEGLEEAMKEQARERLEQEIKAMESRLLPLPDSEKKETEARLLEAKAQYQAMQGK